VFSGKIFDVYQWPQKMFDGREETFEMLKRADTAQVMVVRDNKVLVVREEQPGREMLFDLPQGRVGDEDDSWLTAAQRELREETGLVSENWKLVSVAQPFMKIEWFVPLYLAQGVTEELPQHLDPGGEKIELVWLDFATFQRAIMSGEAADMSYLMPFFAKITTMDELKATPAFTGLDTNR
jgi:8-oxo-dGTP pyrophosphatase MutT (NUDIX family)